MEEISSSVFPFPFQEGLLHFSGPPLLLPINPAAANMKNFDPLLNQPPPPPPPPPPPRKIMRRDVERQRRKEMGALYKTLLTLIPLHYIKGKRSTSDRLQETVRYVKDLKERVKRFRARKEELVMMKERGGGDVSTVATHHDSSSSPTPLPTTASSPSLLSSSSGSNSNMVGEMGGSRVAVKPCKVGGVEVTLTIAPPASGLSLSTVLKLLVAHGMSIHICSSLKLNHTILHTIHAQVTDLLPGLLRSK
ncbi:unnamed protein product [Cuscuta epithymum]|uniref:BHLH domain-containing protein n=1 Tax=Cuscuta epithymum TaxID=186058 RepID=A0AAV0FPN7_9ASTE|nr:unnamed protein product [Cuscuta epithymum]